MKYAEITVYTNEGALIYIAESYDGFVDEITEALGKGLVSVTTIEASRLVINPANIVAVEVKMYDDIPPVTDSKITE